MKKIAVIFGGKSSEYKVSLSSAYAVLTNINHEKYEIIPVGIKSNGCWYIYRGSYDNIKADTWAENSDELREITFSLNPEKPGFVSFTESGLECISFDYAFPILHGKNGEDGSVQGMLELMGIPVIGCGCLSSALCMDKNKAHLIASAYGVSVPKAVTVSINERSICSSLIENLRYPLFVKPVNGGSSYGITKISSLDELDSALSLAFEYDCEAIIEEEIKGFEVGCSVIGVEDLTVGRVDEIELHGGFLDFEEKYSRISAKIHMPARIDKEIEEKIQEEAKKVYRILGCSGFARVDFFYTPEGEIVFNEVNSIPGMTDKSRFPAMLSGIGVSFSEMIEKIIGLYEV